jgi:hypothetical protein
MLGQEPTGLRRPHALAGPAQERRAELRLEQRDLTGDGRLRERQAACRRGERAGVDDGAESGQLPGIEHVDGLDTRSVVQSCGLNASAGS